MVLLNTQQTDEIVITGSFYDFIYKAAQNGCRCSELLRKYLPYPTLRRRMLSIGNYFAVRENGSMISYTPPGRKPEYTPSGTWSRKGRQEMKAGKFIQAILPTVKAADVEAFVNSLKLQTAEYQIQTDSDIETVYISCTAAGSCMVGEPINEFYNAFGCKAIYVKKSDRIIARAIFWPQVETNDGEKTMIDRIYGDQDGIEALRQHAINNGYLYRAHNNNEYEDITDGTSYIYPITARAKYVLSDVYAPYLDTLKYCGQQDGKTFVSNASFRTFISLRETNGEGLGYDDNTVQLENGDRVSEDDAIYLDYNGREGYYHIDCCSRIYNGQWRHNDDIETADDGTNICPQSDDTEGYILTHDGLWYPEDDVIFVDDEYYHLSEVAAVEIDGDEIYVLKSQIREL